ncbi:hypothetical protein FQZ97_655940 [compost metagenome]
MAPPELAADAPVLDVVHPLVVGVDPVLGHELHLARLHGGNRLVGDRGAAGVVLVALGGHGDEPLVGQHGLDHLAGARAARHHQLVFLGLDQQAGGFQVGHHGLARHEAVQAAVLLGRVVIDGGVERQHADDRQLVALAHRVVVGVVRGRDLDHAGAELAVHVGIGDHRDLALAQRQLHILADQRAVALVLGVDHHGHVTQQGFGAGGRHGQVTAAVDQRVGDVPEEAVFLFALHFQIGHGRHQHRVPVHQTLAAVDQALLVQLHEGVGDDLAELLVHGEVLAAPVHRVAHAAHLRGDGVAAFFLPFPDLGDEVLARLGGRGAHVVAADALGLQLALHHDLRGDAGVVGARYPDRVGAGHAVVAREAVHDGLVERVAHVQRAGHIRRRQLDRERGCAGLGHPGAAETRFAVAALLPLGTPAGFERGGFERFGQG